MVMIIKMGYYKRPFRVKWGYKIRFIEIELSNIGKYIPKQNFSSNNNYLYGVLTLVGRWKKTNTRRVSGETA